MNTVADRIREKMTARKVRQVDIVEATGASKGAVSKWLSDTNTPKGENLIRLADLLHTNSNWLLTGTGSDAPHFIDGQTLESMNIGTVKDMDQTDLDSDEFAVPYFKTVPVSAGNKELSVQEATTEILKIKKNVARLAGASMTYSFCYNLEGNSMEPKISDKAQCVADSSKTDIKDGKIYCFRHGLMRRTKYLFWQPDGGLLIRSENKDYEDEIIAPADLNEIEILGWVYTWQNVDRW